MPTWTKDSGRRSEDSEMLKGLVAGAIGGLAATWVMTQFMSQMQKLQTNATQQRKTEQEVRLQTEADREAQEREKEAPTLKVARTVSHKILRMPLREEKKQLASNVVHYAFGTLSGAAYGAMAEVSPTVRTAMGLPFGAGVWFAADEVALPALKLTAGPQHHPVAEHASALAAHLIYGFTTDVVRRGVRRSLRETRSTVDRQRGRMRRQCGK